ncbi:MAG: (d)CMP kinase [Deltaproteobacteria bacterium]|nr:(d)CMP kinase [Deltaproteobacteria bacterium]
MSRIIVTIDGLSGTGKSSIATKLANKLGFRVLHSGLVYRAFAKLLLEELQCIPSKGLETRKDELVYIANLNRDFLYKAARGEFNPEDFRDWGQKASEFAQLPIIREILLPFQREAYTKESFVAEGRDMGTVVFPDAHAKIFIETALTIRVLRRLNVSNPLDLKALEHPKSLLELMSLAKRDLRDTIRNVAPCRKATEAFVVINHLNIEVTVKCIIDYVSNRLNLF